MKSRLDCFGDDRQIAFHVRNKMEIDLGIGMRRHGTKPAQAGCGLVSPGDPAVKRLV